jgi:hypothetical protein
MYTFLALEVLKYTTEIEIKNLKIEISYKSIVFVYP